VGGTPANRLIHRETNQLLIGPYVIDEKGNVRVVPPSKMPGRLTGAARHVSDSNKVYVATMETGLYELDMRTLAVNTLIRENGKNDGAIAKLLKKTGRPFPVGWKTAPRTRVPGYHAKGLGSGFGRVFVSNNGEDSPAARRDPFVPSGVLAWWNEPGRDWSVIRRCQFTEVTTPDGIYGNEHPAENPVWAMGWDAKSVILGVTTNGTDWTYYRLPKASHAYDGAHGWNTEWPRIRDVGFDDGTLLATMHGTFWRFPRGFSPANPNGIRPISTYLKVIGDFCRWGDRIVFGCDDQTKSEFLGKRSLKKDAPRCARSQSNLWFVKPEELKSFGPPSGEGYVWIDEDVKAGDVSDPYLYAGYETMHFSFVRADGSPVRHELLKDCDWVRVKCLEDAKSATACFRYGPAEVEPPSLDAKNPFITVTDDKGKEWRFPNVNGDTNVVCREIATERDLLYVGGVWYEVPAENAGGFSALRPVALADEPVKSLYGERGLMYLNDKPAVIDDLWKNGTAPAAYWLWEKHGRMVEADDSITAAKYPDADAVLVDSIESIEYAPDGTYTNDCEEAVKILTERGKREESVFSIHYSARYGKAEILSITVTGENGETRDIDFAATLKDATDNSSMSANIYDPLDRKLVCQIPGLEIGDTVRRRYRRIAEKPRVENVFADSCVFEWSLPIVRSELRIKSPAARPLAKIAVRNPIGNIAYTNAVLEDGATLHAWTATNSPQAFPEPSMPPLWTELENLRVSTAHDWREISDWYWNLSLPHLEKTTAEMTNVVESLGGDLEKIYRWVAQQVRYMGLTMEDKSPGYAPHDVDITFGNRYGVCRDKAALLVAMLRIAGHEAYPVLIHVGAKMDEDVPSPFFNHAIVAVADAASPDGYRLMDPTAESSRDIFPAYLGNRSYLVAKKGGERLLVSPAKSAEENSLHIDTKGTLGKDGAAVVETAISFSGINDTIYRNALLRRTPDERRRYFERVVSFVSPGAELLSFELFPENLADSSKPFSAKFKAKLPEVALEGDSLFEVAPPFFSGFMGLADRVLDGETSLEKRRFTLEVFSTARTDEKIELEIPDSFGEAESLPKRTDRKGQYAYLRDSSLDGRTLVFERSLAVNTLEFKPPEYSAMLEAVKFAEAADRERATFAKDDVADADVAILFSRYDYNLSSTVSWTVTNEFSKEILTYDGKKKSSELVWNFNPLWKNIEVVSATVSNANGRVSKVSPHEITLLDADGASLAPRYPAGKKLVVNLPSVEVGSVISVKTATTVESSPVPFSATFLFDSKDPVGEISATVKKNGKEIFSRKVVKAKKIPSEASQPDAELWRDAETVSFASVEDCARRLKRAVDVAPAKPPFKVEGTPAEKIVQIRDWMHKNVKIAGPSLYSLPIEKQLTGPEKVLDERYASRLDYVRTMCALFKGAGLDADIVFAANNDGESAEAKKFRAEHPDPGFYAYAICRVKTGGGTMFVGTESEYAFPGATPFDGSEFLDPVAGAIGIVEAMGDNLKTKRENFCTVRVRENGAADIEVEKLIYGSAAESFRREYSEILPEDRSRQFLAIVKSYAQSAEATSELLTDVESCPAKVKYSIYVPDFATVSGDVVSFKLPDVGSRPAARSSEPRKTPFEISSFRPETTEMRIILPPEFPVVERLPSNFDFGDAAAGFTERQRVSLKSLEDGSTEVTVRRERGLGSDLVLGAERFAAARERSRVMSSRRERTIAARKEKTK